jgi:hypothetical protein
MISELCRKSYGRKEMDYDGADARRLEFSKPLEFEGVEI